MIYLDNAATTRPSAAAKAAVLAAMEDFGNPSSVHAMGIAAEKIVTAAREAIANIIGAKPSEIYFTSGGTEANNLAILGAANLHGGAIVTTGAEHPSIVDAAGEMARRGVECRHIDHPGGTVATAALVSAIARPGTLISIHHVNNETGCIQDIAALGKAAHSAKAVFHVDAAQSFCKLPIDVNTMGIDLLTMSAHKIGGLKGVGALYVRSGLHVRPMMLGGGQEKSLRGGTENVVGIGAMGAAAAVEAANMAENYARALALKAEFLNGLSALDGLEINGENTSPYILNISIKDIRPEVLLNTLSDFGMYVSAGAACSSNRRQKAAKSAVLLSYGYSQERAATALRISFGAENTPEQMEAAATLFADCTAKLRQIPRLRG